MSGRVLRALVVVAVAATVVLALASGATSRTLADRSWEWSSRDSITLFFWRDVAGQQPLVLQSLHWAEIPCKGHDDIGTLEAHDVVIAVAANGTFSHAGTVADATYLQATFTVSGQVTPREIRGALRIAGTYQGSEGPCPFDSGARTFVARCSANCPPPPNRLTTLLVPYRSIAGIALGMTRKQVLRVLGRCPRGTCARIRGNADSITVSTGGLGIWRFHDGGTISAAFRRGRVVEIATSFRDVKLASGVGMGSPLAALRAAFPRKTVRCLRVGHSAGRVCYARRIIRRTVLVTRFDAATRSRRVTWLEVARCKPGITGSSFPCPNDYG